MKNPNVTNRNTYTGEVIDSVSPRQDVKTFLTSRSARPMVENAMLAVGKNRCRALLAKSSMEEAAALAFAADRLSNMAPQGTKIYQEMLRAYGQKAIESIERW